MCTKNFVLADFIILIACFAMLDKTFSLRTEPACYQNRCIYNNKTYAFFYTPLSYMDATQVCKTSGGQIAPIRDAATNLFINKLLAQARYYGYWTDIKDWTKEDKAPEMVAFSGWSHGLPKRGKSAAGSNRCPYLDMALNLDWNDANCDTTQLPYICEYKATLEKNEGKPQEALACSKGGSCFEVIHDLANMEGAKNDCMKRGGTLALIEKKDAHDFLKSLVFERRKWMNITDESTVGTDYEKLNFFETWLGVQYVAREWTYTNGTAIQYSKWRAGEPNNFKNLTEGCAIFFDVWNDLNCDTKIKYLCGLPKDTKSTSDCHSDICYEVFDNPLSFNDAMADCKNKGGTLAHITSEEINSVAKAAIQRKNASNVWIGILSTSGEFQYSDGTQLTFSNWDEGQPRHWKWQEHCVTVIKNNRWSAEDCSKKFSFICEYEEEGRWTSETQPTTQITVTTSATTVEDVSDTSEPPCSKQSEEITTMTTPLRYDLSKMCHPPSVTLKLCIHQASICLKMFANVCECLQMYAAACQQIFSFSEFSNNANFSVFF